MYNFPEHIYGYTSLRTGNSKKDLTKNFKNTKLYNDYMTTVKAMRDNMVAISDEEITPDERLITDNMIFNPDHMLQVDIMTSAREGMYYKLNCIVEQADKLPPFDTIIIVMSISAFGGCENIKKYYKIFQEKQIGILIPDNTRESGLSEYSTCGFDFQPRSASEYDRAFDLVERLEQKDIPDNRGRIGSEYTESFRTAFWLYELFKIPEKMAVAMSGFSKNGFHMKADNYEQTFAYKEELKIFDQNFLISNLIKRNRPVPEDFDKIIHWYEKMDDLELACILCKVPMIFPIDYERLRMKQDGGKKELARCLKEYDTALIQSFEDWVQGGNAPTDFYTQCSLEQYLCPLQ